MASKIEKIRHSLSHLLAIAVLEKYPHAKLGIGPIIDNGFYYDFALPTEALREGGMILAELEKEIKKFIKEDLKFEKEEIDYKKAKEIFSEQPYKLELIEELRNSKQPISIYKTHSPQFSILNSQFFIDLCAGPHVKSSKEINPDAFKLDRLAGAYWKGSEKNPMLTRIYGIAFETKKELDEFVAQEEEAKKRDHKILGPQLDLFSFSELVGSGLPLWTPKGTILRNILDDFVWELREKAGYVQVDIPHITKKDLYEKSGHWEKFKDDLFKITTRDGHVFVMKPMNCPHHTQIYSRKQWSYRELPQRYANTTKVYRDEQTGELAGLARVRAITQDDAHVFCRHKQVKEEIMKIWDIVENFYSAVGFKLQARLSLHDPQNPKLYLGSPEIWKTAEVELKKIVKERGIKVIEAIGEAAFYGPKIDFMAKDSLGREWQVATIQLDMNMPENFDLSCVNEKGEKERIVMIHAAIMGSIERYLAILIEHFSGAFPTWLAPVQAVVIPISEKSEKYAQEINDTLKLENIRAEINNQNETLGKRIREAELQKIPYIIVVGEKEAQNKSVNVRHYKQGQIGESSLGELIGKIKVEIENKPHA